MVWSYVVTDLLGVQIGRVENAYERRLTLPLNGLPTAAFRMRLDDPLAQEISDRNGDCLLKVYQSTTLRFIGELMSIEEGGPVREGEGVSLTITAAGPFWRLQKRLFGIPYPSAAQSFTDVAANTIIATMLNSQNAIHDTGIRNGTQDTLYNTTIGVESSISLKPVGEIIAEMQASKVPYPISNPPTLIAGDTFTGGSTSAGLSGQTDDIGNTWSGAGDADDFQTNPLAYPNKAVRGALSDGATGQEGRWAINGVADQTDVLVGVDILSSRASVDGVGGDGTLWMGVFARYVDSNNWVRCLVDWHAHHFYVFKCVAGTQTTLESGVDVGGLAANLAYGIRLAIDELGNFSAWLYDAASGFESLGGPQIYGQDDDLAIGGPLETGKIGFTDHRPFGLPDVSRVYDNFVGSAFPGPMSFDFEVAPQEPAADAVPYPGTLPVIGNLNIRYAIGTSKPNAVFEYGDGQRSAKKYTRVTNREGMVNQAYALPPNFPDSTDLRVSTNQESIDARGALMEVVPNDNSNPELRQAWADANTQIRGVPRQVITFEPSDSAPVFGTDYIVGDTVTGRAKVNGDTRFNAEFRVYSVDISVDDNGKADVVPTLVVE